MEVNGSRKNNNGDRERRKIGCGLRKTSNL